MPNYQKCVIYKLCCRDITVKDIYIGSTCNFTGRKYGHKGCCTNENRKNYNLKVYKFIRDNGGWNNWDMILIEEHPCENISQKTKRERYWCEMLESSLNSDVPGRTDKEYREDYKEKITEKQKEYQEIHKKELAEKAKEKINCPCGSVLSRAGKVQHEKTKKHIQYINQN